MKHRLWPLCETVARRLKAANLAGYGVVLKLKMRDFRQFTRSRQLEVPTQLAEMLFRAACPLIDREATGPRFRLIGIGCTELTDGTRADPPDLLNPQPEQLAQVERAIDAVRARLDAKVIMKGRTLELPPSAMGRRHGAADDGVEDT